MMPKKNIEVEIRGPLSNKQFKSLSRSLKKDGRFLDRYNQLVIFFQQNIILNIAKDALRIKKDESGEKVCFKKQTRSDSSSELEFYLKNGEYKKAIKFFQLIGFDKYSLAPAARWEFLYRGVRVSLKNKCIIGPHYEMEVMVGERWEADKTKKRLLVLARKLGLKVWAPEEYSRHKSSCWSLHKKKIKRNDEMGVRF